MPRRPLTVPLVAAATAAAVFALPASAGNVGVASAWVAGATFNGPALLTDGDFGRSVWWTDALGWQPGTPARACGAVLTLDFGELYQLQDLAYGADHNDRYEVQVSLDGTDWDTLFVSLPPEAVGGFQGPYPWTARKSSVVGDADYAATIDFAPAVARYARVFATGGDGFYAVSELQFSGFRISAVPEPASPALLAAGLLAVGWAARRRLA